MLCSASYELHSDRPDALEYDPAAHAVQDVPVQPSRTLVSTTASLFSHNIVLDPVYVWQDDRIESSLIASPYRCNPKTSPKRMSSI